jgi:hypothetical protein
MLATKEHEIQRVLKHDETFPSGADIASFSYKPFDEPFLVSDAHLAFCDLLIDLG